MLPSLLLPIVFQVIPLSSEYCNTAPSFPGSVSEMVLILIIGRLSVLKSKQGPSIKDCSLFLYFSPACKPPTIQAFEPEAALVIFVFAGVPSNQVLESPLATHPP